MLKMKSLKYVFFIFQTCEEPSLHLNAQLNTEKLRDKLNWKCVKVSAHKYILSKRRCDILYSER